MPKFNKPDPISDLNKFIKYLENKTPFSFVRFSDGEIEILRNRYLEINDGKTIFRGRHFENKFPVFDSKKFDPSLHQNIRRDLLSSSLFRSEFFFKGIPTTHNEALKDREFLLRLNGGFESNMTFSDLFLNSNYLKYRAELVPLFSNYENVYVIANYRSKLTGVISNANHIAIPDNFFENYDEVIKDVYRKINNISDDSLVLSSASSLSNILGHMLYQKNPNITFLDVGTSINDLLSLDNSTRAYHQQKKSIFHEFMYKKSKGYEIKW